MLQQFDPRNKNIKVWVGHRLVDRSDAKVSVFDSSVQGGDAVWEGMRVYENGVFCLERHLDRLGILLGPWHLNPFQHVLA